MHIATLRKLAKPRGFEITKADVETCRSNGGACYHLSFVSGNYRYTQRECSAAGCASDIARFGDKPFDDIARDVLAIMKAERRHYFKNWSREYIGAQAVEHAPAVPLDAVAKYPALTEEQIEALQTFALVYGRSWKNKLNNVYWYNARIFADNNFNQDKGYILHGLRNTHGPSWLAAYKLPEVRK